MKLLSGQRWIPWAGFVLALVLRFWNLGTPPQIVSDEVSFVNDGWAYVTHQTYFDPHPPLGKLELGLALKYFGFHPTVWRSLSAVGGALIIPLLWWIAWRMTKKRVAANIAMILVLLDGLLLVDSRLGLINISYILPALAAMASLLKSLEGRRPGPWLFIAGTCLGAAVATKWIALLVGGPMLIVWLWPQIFGEQQLRRTLTTWLIGLWWLLAWPAIVYWLVFVWHFTWLGIPVTFIDTNLQLLNYHLSVPSAGDVYQQPWWGWLLAWRPFPYWYSSQLEHQSIIMSLPNPWIWWTGAVIFLVNLVRGWRDGVSRLLNMVLLFAWIPFAFIQRIMYSYHSLLFDVWLMLLLGVILDRAWDRHRTYVWIYIAIAAAVFIWFLPWYLNLPLTPAQHELRRWLPTWNIFS